MDGVSWWSSFLFFFLHVLVQFSQHHLLFVEETIFYSIVCSCPLCQIFDQGDMGLFLGSLFCSVKDV